MQKFDNTPSSELSVYFDAPIAIFPGNKDSMLSSQDMPQPQNYTMPSSQDMPHPVAAYQLHDDGPIPPVEADPRGVKHPNGSEGWLPAVDEPLSRIESPIRREGSTSPRVRGYGEAPTTNGMLGRSSSRRSAHTSSDGKIIPGSAFVNGAGTTGPYATAEGDESLRTRGLEAHASLTPKQKTKIFKDEVKQGKRLSKIIKQEGKTEKQALSIAIEELSQLQKLQKNAVKSEARVQANHSKLQVTFKRVEEAYLNAKMKYDTALAHLNSEAEALETLRNGAKEATERMQDKAAEVDSLRATLAVDEREREVKLTQLKGSTSKSGGSRWR